jgi:hypothetical protein
MEENEKKVLLYCVHCVLTAPFLWVIQPVAVPACLCCCVVWSSFCGLGESAILCHSLGLPRLEGLHSTLMAPAEFWYSVRLLILIDTSLRASGG